MKRPLPFGRDWIDYWRKASDANPEGTMNEVLRCMNIVRERKPFNRELWTELAEIGQKVLSHVPQALRDGFLRVTSHDKKRRIDALHVCHARMSIFVLMAQKDPAHALRRVARELGTLPFSDTFVRSPRALRKSFHPSDDEWKLYGVYRLNLEGLYANLLLKTNQGVDRDILLWGIADAAHTAAEHSMECRSGSNGQLDIPSQEPSLEVQSDGYPQQYADGQELITV